MKSEDPKIIPDEKVLPFLEFFFIASFLLNLANLSLDISILYS
jgi:hypothetical protein